MGPPITGSQDRYQFLSFGCGQMKLFAEVEVLDAVFKSEATTIRVWCAATGDDSGLGDCGFR